MSIGIILMCFLVTEAKKLYTRQKNDKLIKTEKINFLKNIVSIEFYDI